MRKVIKDGKTIWVKEPGDEVAEEAKVEDAEKADENKADDDKEVEAEAKKLAREMVAEMRGEMAKETAKRWIDQPGNEKLKMILGGKDLFSDKDKLTAEEKIVGFYHALVTHDSVAAKALSEGTAADGGYLFPDEFLSELIKPLSELPRARALVRVITMRRDVMKIPTLVSGPKVYWTAENAAKTTTTAAFNEATLTARKAAAILYASDELVEDSTEIDVVRTIIELFSEAIGREEDRVILRGNGTTEPTGIFTATLGGTVTCSGNLDGDDLINLVYALPTKYRAGASFLVHPSNVREMRKLKDSNGQYLWQPSLVAGTPDRFLGYPIHEFYDVPEASIAFGNWKLAYYLGDRKGMTVKVSQDTETAFTKDQTAIRVVVRLAGNVVLAEATRLLGTIP